MFGVKVSRITGGNEADITKITGEDANQTRRAKVQRCRGSAIVYLGVGSDAGNRNCTDTRDNYKRD